MLTEVKKKDQFELEPISSFVPFFPVSTFRPPARHHDFRLYHVAVGIKWPGPPPTLHLTSLTSIICPRSKLMNEEQESIIFLLLSVSKYLLVCQLSAQIKNTSE